MKTGGPIDSGISNISEQVVVPFSFETDFFHDGVVFGFALKV